MTLNLLITTREFQLLKKSKKKCLARETRTKESNSFKIMSLKIQKLTKNIVERLLITNEKLKTDLS